MSYLSLLKNYLVYSLHGTSVLTLHDPEHVNDYISHAKIILKF
jgi:hypothetical protein